MKLEFRLLVVDDEPDGISQAVTALSDNLSEKGFSLTPVYESQVSSEILQRLSRSKGKQFDLVAVDYRLGNRQIDGAVVAAKLRIGLPYTDMVFYSSLSVNELLGILAKNFVPGVFVAARGDLDQTLTGIANTIIAKSVDLNHMRGIAMAEVAEMDVLMQDTLVAIFSCQTTNVQSAAARTIEKLQGRYRDNLGIINETIQSSGIPGLVQKSQIFSLADKYHAIRRLLKCLPNRPSDQTEVLDSYEEDIIKARNMLAHVREESTPDGTVRLRSISAAGDTVVIDESWMSDCRAKMQRQKTALSEVCDLLKQCFLGL